MDIAPKDPEFIKKHQAKEQELNLATDEMERLSANVKEAAKSVKKGTATKKELAQAVENLSVQGGKVKILAAEAKMFGEWKTIDETLPPTDTKNKLLLIISIFALIYLVKKS